MINKYLPAPALFMFLTHSPQDTHPNLPHPPTNPRAARTQDERRPQPRDVGLRRGRRLLHLCGAGDGGYLRCSDRAEGLVLRVGGESSAGEFFIFYFELI